ncbi:hypothetical protein BJ912DRAFT_1065796 [Pholiota molesta]|nr:hypothetical protein BJ912DRAFT_1065796 [Pholiota molesta]
MTEAALGPRPRESEACSHSRRVNINSNTTSRPLDRNPAPPPFCLSTRSRLSQIHTPHHSDFYPWPSPPAHKSTPALHPAHHLSRTESPLHLHLQPCRLRSNLSLPLYDVWVDASPSSRVVRPPTCPLLGQCGADAT